MQFGTPSSAVRFWRAKPFAIAIAVFAILSLLLVGAQYQANTHAQSTHLNWTNSSTHTATMAAGTRVSMQTLMQKGSYSSQQLAQLNATRQAELTKLGDLPTPKPQHIAKVTTSVASRGPEFAASKTATGPAGPLADGDLSIEQNVNVAGGICNVCAASFVQEASIAGNGKYLFQTGNWYAAISSNGGSSWSALNPYAVNSGFCCDQTITYEPSRNVFIWQTLDLGGNQVQLDIVNGQFSGACLYTFNSTSIGMAANQLPDFPHVAVSTDDTYLTWNTYDPTGATWENSALLRLPTSALATCSGFSYNFLTRTDVFTLNLVTGSTEGMNFASYWCTSACTDGSQISFFNWSESSGTYGNVILNVNPYTFNFGGQNCASADAVVSNWCGFADSRGGTGAYLSRGGYRGFGGQVISFSISAGAGGAFPFAYVVREYFVLPTLTYKGNDNLWSSTWGIVYPGCADSPYFGHVACTISIGGGTAAANDLYPSTAAFMEDKQHTTQPWVDYFLCTGSGNSPANRWGDYTTTHEWSDGEHWMQVDWCMADNSGDVFSFTAIVGESRNHNGFLTWIGR